VNIVERAVVVGPPRLFTFGCYAPLHTRPRDPYSAPELEPGSTSEPEMLTERPNSLHFNSLICFLCGPFDLIPLLRYAPRFLLSEP
jgi:hypothetical protein